MKKAFVIVQSKDADAAVNDLRSLGCLHVEHQVAPQSQDINVLQESLALANSCCDVFTQEKVEAEAYNPGAGLATVDWKQKAIHIVDLWKRYDQLEAYGRRLVNSIALWEAWGDFQPQEIQKLKESGIYIKFYLVPARRLSELPQDAAVKNIFKSKGLVGCVAVAARDFESPFKDLPLSKMSLSDMKKRLEQNNKTMQFIKGQIRQATSFYAQLQEIRKGLEKEIELHQAIAGMNRQDSLSYITGYIPFDAKEKLGKSAKEKKWGLLITEPSETDNVPTLIRNPRWISLISPVLKFLEILPGYKELDISLPFLIFFSIFFGMLIGDAGYGLVYTAITFLFHQKAKKKGRDTSRFFLFYILSFCAIIWGTLTGTFFGQEWVLKTGYKPLMPALVDAKGIQRFCFFLGALHLSIAHAWRATLKLPSLSALSDVGWGCILWAVFFIAKTLILGDSFPFFGKWLIIIGVSLVILFTNPQRNIFKAVGEGLGMGMLPLSLMSTFTDVVSYIRLFAVGMAGVAIADAFNAMAAMVGTNSVLAFIMAAFITVIGHSLAIALGPVSVLVHGVRLNVLEFSGHANVTWSGLTYKPLKE